MTLINCKVKSALFVLGCLLTCLPTVGNAQNDEQANVQRVVDQFFAAFQQKDLSSAMALWSGNSPDLTYGRQLLQHTFAAYRTIELKNVRVNKITFDKDNATVQLTAELTVVDTMGGRSATPLQMIRTMQMVRETGVWKIWNI
ncbi:MAG TPA: nuclear transport factor 2 family protein [Pyrinomonadaceae bacterium]|nr:nuclear transport factor 2 family protein [Pyrinomonadaceae bacterium]